jgi:hypothetical protein
MFLLIEFPESDVVDEPEVFPSRHHPPWFSILMYNPGDEK